jgi:hypothetical protein
MRVHAARLAAIILMLGGATLHAQDQPAQSHEPTDQQGVARVSFIHGDVSSQRGDNGEWVAMTLNTPIVTGDRVSTGQNSRAELQLDWANILRMSANATVNVTTLDRSNIHIQVGQGLTTYSVLKGGQTNSEIDTPNAAVRPLAEGEYRILVDSNAETQLTVRNGSADVSTPEGSTRVERGQVITIQGTDSPQYRTDPASGRDDWDSWNDDRNKLITTAESWRHTDRYYVGSHDLDSRIMARYGFRASMQAGRHIATAVGSGSLTTAGLGSPMNRGAGHRIITGGGSFTAAVGPGGRGRSRPTQAIIRSGRRRMCLSSASEEAALASGSDSAIGAALAGYRAGRGIGITLGTGVGAVATARSTPETSATTNSMRDSNRSVEAERVHFQT